jgi:hypothetical protein
MRAKTEPPEMASSHRDIDGHPDSADRHGDTRARVAPRLSPLRP